MTATTWDDAADVVVVGMGAAGSAAAIEAHDAGAAVLILEKMPAGREGGNTRVSGSCWFDNTDPERAKVYLRSLCGDHPLPEAVIDVWATETHRNAEWVTKIGGNVAHCGDYAPEYPELEGSDCYGGYLAIDGQMGNGLLFGVLTAALAERGIPVHTGTPATELVQGADGEILGVVAERDGAPWRVQARRGVVLASGGFEANPGMVQDYLGLGGAPAVWGSPGGTGDGLRMALEAGADLWHMANMMTAPGLRVPGLPTGFYTAFWAPVGYVYVGPDGTRFVNETLVYRHGHALRNGRYELYPTQPTFVIFDEATRLAGPVSPGEDTLPVGWNLLVEGYKWSADNSAEVEKGWIKRGDTLAELGAELGIDGAALSATVEQFNQLCEQGENDPFGRPRSTMIPVQQPPYYGFSCGPMLGWSNGGPRRNERAQVLDVAGAVISRLYAAGNISSTYSWCKDGGFHIADALAFGRVAGRQAAGEAPAAS